MEFELEHLPNWLPIIGFITISWTPIERQIDQSLEFLAQAGKIKTKPTSLGQKLCQIQTHAASVIKAKDAIAELVSQTKYIVKIRDIFVHGVVVSCDERKIVIGKSDTRKPGHHIEEFTVTLEQLDPTVRALQAISDRWIGVTEILQGSCQNA